MKITLLFLLLILVGCGSTEQKKIVAPVISDNLTALESFNTGGELPIEQAKLDFQALELSIELFPDTQSIDATAQLSLSVLSPLSSILLDFDRRFNVKAVTVNQHSIELTQVTNTRGKLTIALPFTLMSGDTAEVSIQYQGQPHKAKKAPWDGGFVWQKTPSGANWIATAVQGEGCDLIWPCIDHPSAEPKQVDLYIKVPKPLVAASNGVLLSVENSELHRTFHWQSNVANNNYAISLNVAPYQLLQTDYQSRYGNTIDLQYYHLPEHTLKAEQLFTEFPLMLDFFEQVIGPYPFASEKMGVVDTPFLGMEHQTINAYGNNYKVNKFGFDSLLQHEFAHEWFGNQLTNYDWKDMWLHEGFGTYMQPLYAQYRYGDMAYMAYMYQLRLAIVNKFPVASHESKSEDEVYKPNLGPGQDVYYKGAHILHTLRSLIGDKAFFTAVKKLVYGTDAPTPDNFSPRLANSDEFIQYVNEATGLNYQWFFDVYLYQATLPKLVVEKYEGYMQFNWLTENDAPFPMPLEVSINGETRRLTMTDIRSLLVSDDDVVIIDPHGKVLRDMPHIGRYQRFLASQIKAKSAQ